MAEFLTALSNAGNFTRDDFALVYRAKNKDATESSCRFVLQKLLDSGSIARVGRNNYCVNDKTSRKYTHEYSDLATSAAGKIRETYPELDFRIFELVQLNEFVNHQIAHNAVFIFVEGDLGEYVFDTLKEEYAGHILLNPNADMYHQYWADDMLVIKKLITEAPKGTDDFSAVLSALCLFAPFEEFVNNSFSIPTLVYYLTTAVLFLFFTAQGIEKRRWN